MRFRHLFLLPPLALAFAATAFGGCQTDEELDNFCLFLKDKDSCYQNFLTDIGTQCTMDTFTGTFDPANEKCLIDGINIPPNVVTEVQFDPPIDLTKLPMTTAIMKLLNNGVECGTFEIGADDKLSVSLLPSPQITDPTAECVTSDMQFCGSSFSNTPIAPESPDQSKQLMSTTCPDGTAFRFDRLQVGQQCADQAGLIPQAKLEITPNGIGKEGEVKFSIVYSPEKTLTYFTCRILAALPPCENGVKDGFETDVDCGGSQCVTRCVGEQACINGSDCLSGKCEVSGGIRKCTAM